MEIENNELLQKEYDALLQEYKLNSGKRNYIEDCDMLVKMRDIYERLHPKAKERRLKYGHRN